MQLCLQTRECCNSIIIMYYAPPIGDWLRQNQQYLCGMHCGVSMESILHLFWLYPRIKKFWSKLFLLLRHHYSRSIFLWGAVLRGVLRGDVMKYESMHASHVFHFSHGTSISLHFHLLFHGLELKFWLFGILLRH